jgi:hypothetical protein
MDSIGDHPYLSYGEAIELHHASSLYQGRLQSTKYRTLHSSSPTTTHSLNQSQSAILSGNSSHDMVWGGVTDG